MQMVDAENSPSDAELLVTAGDRSDAFGLLYARHAQTILGYFYRRTRCVDTSADLTAETFAQAFASRRRFRDVGASGLAWLFTIARRQLSHFIRHEKVADRYRHRLGIAAIELGADDYEAVERLIDLDGDRERLREALTALSTREAEAIRLRVVEELPYREVAESIGCSEGAARVRVSRGLSRLADALEET